MTRQIVISLFPNNNYRLDDYWGQFPDRVTEVAAEAGIRHVVYYRAYPDPKPDAPTVTVEQMESPAWIHREMVPLIRQYDRCIIHTHAPPCRSGLWSVRGRLRRRFRWVMTDHFPFPERRPGAYQEIKRAAKRLLRRAGFYPDYFVAVSGATRARFVGHFGEQGVFRILNGVARCADPAPPPSGKPVRALFAGRLLKDKGVHVLLKAMALARSEGLEMRLRMAGGGPEQEALESFVRGNHLEDCVELCGPVKDIHRLYAEADLFIIPSVWPDPCPLVSIEAQSHGLPCIYTDRGGLPETQRDGVTGIMVPGGDAEAIVRAMRRLQDDAAEYRRMRIGALENFKAHFTIERMARDYFALYQSIFSDGRTWPLR